METKQPQQAGRRHAISRVGVVDSISGSKTVRVASENLVKDRRYGKYLRRRTRLMAHDAKSEAKVGDQVEIAQCRRISKRKTWRLVRVVKSSDKV